MADYPIPPWLGPQPQFGELAARGLAIGQAIANQRQQAQLQMEHMNQQAANAQLEAQMQTMRINAQMEIAQQEALQRQQQAAIEADYKQMALAQARERMMTQAAQNEQRMKIDLFKANTDWQKAAQSFSAQKQMTDFINTNAPTLGLEEATKRGYMQFGHLLSGGMPGGVLQAPRRPPEISTINVPGRGPVSVVQGGQALPEAMPANMPATWAAPGLVQVPKSGGGFEYRSVDPTPTSKYDARIAKIEDSFYGPYIADRNKKAASKEFQDMVDRQREMYDRLVKAREEELKLFNALKPAMPGYAATNAPSTGTTNRSFKWTGSALTPR